MEERKIGGLLSFKDKVFAKEEGQEIVKKAGFENELKSGNPVTKGSFSYFQAK